MTTTPTNLEALASLYETIHKLEDLVNELVTGHASAVQAATQRVQGVLALIQAAIPTPAGVAPPVNPLFTSNGRGVGAPTEAWSPLTDPLDTAVSTR